MTAPLDLTPAEETDALAAEYVLGVLALQDRLAAEARCKSDADFANRVAQWEAHFADLNDGYESTPAPNLMPQIEAKIFGKQTTPRRSWWGYLAGAGVAAMLAVAVLVNVPPNPEGPVMTASLAGDATDLVFAAVYADGGLTLSHTAGTAADATHDYELWVIIGDAAPKSLGVISSAVYSQQLASLPDGATLAITLEQKGGSPTGAPLGPVLISGVVTTS